MNTTKASIVFITGAFVSNNCWDEWKIYFENEGYKNIAPAWPYKDAAPEELRNRDDNDPIALNTITSLADYFIDIINKFPEKPILVGHALGGLLVQLLLQRQAAIAGVAIHSFPPIGLGSAKLSILKAVLEDMAIHGSDKKTYLIPFATWQFAIVNGMDYEQQKELYYLYAIPESGKIIREAFKRAVKIDFTNPHPPLLLTSGSNDKLIPASLNYFNYKKYAAPGSITNYKEFKGHNHLVFGHPAWRTEADYILHWLQRLK